MFDIGRVCIKTAGRDTGKYAVVIDILDKDKGYVLIDGYVRRRKCNIKHLEPLEKTVNIKKSAGTQEVIKALKELGIIDKSFEKKQQVIEKLKSKGFFVEKSREKSPKPVRKGALRKKAKAVEQKPAKEKKAKETKTKDKKDGKKDDKVGLKAVQKETPKDNEVRNSHKDSQKEEQKETKTLMKKEDK